MSLLFHVIFSHRFIIRVNRTIVFQISNKENRAFQRLDMYIVKVERRGYYVDRGTKAGNIG